MSIQRIAYIGNYTAPWCTEVHIAATLEDLGFEVDRIQENDVALPEIEKRALASDLLLYTRTWGLGPEATDMWRRLEAAGVPTASYHLDLYYGISRQKGVTNDSFWTTQYVFTPDGDPAAQAWFESQGINHHWIKPGVYKRECIPGRPNPERFPHPIAFVGSWKNYHKEWPHRKMLVQHLLRKWKGRVGVYGHESLGTIRGLPLNDLYATATVVVGDSLCPGYSKPNYWSDRVYETLGRGGYLLHPQTPGIEREFNSGHHLTLYPYGDFKAVDTFIERALDNPEVVRGIANDGQRYVYRNCTYHDRLTQALAVIQGDQEEAWTG